MTKSQEKGHNEITEAALREAARTGKDVCTILRLMLKTAKKADDGERKRKIEKAEKILGCRNREKRRRQR